MSKIFWLCPALRHKNSSSHRRGCQLTHKLNPGRSRSHLVSNPQDKDWPIFVLVTVLQKNSYFKSVLQIRITFRDVWVLNKQTDLLSISKSMCMDPRYDTHQLPCLTEVLSLDNCDSRWLQVTSPKLYITRSTSHGTIYFLLRLPSSSHYLLCYHLPDHKFYLY